MHCYGRRTKYMNVSIHIPEIRSLEELKRWVPPEYLHLYTGLFPADGSPRATPVTLEEFISAGGQADGTGKQAPE
jgi:hypothetical protein